MKSLTTAQIAALSRIAQHPRGLSNFSGDGFRRDTAHALMLAGMVTLESSLVRPRRSLSANLNAPHAPRSAATVVEVVARITPAGTAFLANR